MTSGVESLSVSQALRFRHKKRGTDYSPLLAVKIDEPRKEGDFIHFVWGEQHLVASVQSSAQPLIPKDTWMMIYYGGTHIWARTIDEMNDGRFETVPKPS